MEIQPTWMQITYLAARITSKAHKPHHRININGCCIPEEIVGTAYLRAFMLFTIGLVNWPTEHSPISRCTLCFLFYKQCYWYNDGTESQFLHSPLGIVFVKSRKTKIKWHKVKASQISTGYLMIFYLVNMEFSPLALPTTRQGVNLKKSRLHWVILWNEPKLKYSLFFTEWCSTNFK